MNSYAGNPGRSSHKLSLAASEKIYECREHLSALFRSFSPENVVFTYNATYAINIALKGTAQPGDHILISNFEHNSVIRPVFNLQKIGVSHSVFNACCDDETIIKNISAAILPNTRIIIVSHSSNICGITLPIAKIGKLCHDRGLLFIVDASQSAGIRDIDVVRDNIDILCAPGHKGLYGPQGTGFLLISDSAASTVFNTIIEGGNGVNSLIPDMPDFRPERLESGTLATPAIAGLCEGVKFVRRIGPENIFDHEIKLYRRMKNNLHTICGVKVYADHIDDSSVLLFNIGNLSSAEVSSKLDEAGICTRSGFHCSPLAHKMLGTGDDGAVRVSFGYFNTVAEVDYFCDVLSIIAHSSKK